MQTVLYGGHKMAVVVTQFFFFGGGAFCKSASANFPLTLPLIKHVNKTTKHYSVHDVETLNTRHAVCLKQDASHTESRRLK